MTIALRGISLAGAAFTTSTIVNKPTGTVDGDFMLLQISISSLVSVTGPSGWTLVASAAAGSLPSDNRNYIYYKVAASEPANYTVTCGFTIISIGIITWYSSTSDAIIVDSSATYSNVAATDEHIAASAFSSKPNSVLCCFYSVGNSPAGDPHAGMTERWDEAGASAIYLMTESLSDVGITGARRMTSTVGIFNSAAVTVVIVENITVNCSTHQFYISEGHYQIVYGGIDITRYCQASGLEAIVSEFDATNLASLSAESAPGGTVWNVKIAGLLDKTIDDILGIDALSPPGTLNDLIILIGTGYCTTIFVWTGTSAVGAFVNDYKIGPNDPLKEGTTFSANLGISGGPVQIGA